MPPQLCYKKNWKFEPTGKKQESSKQVRCRVQGLKLLQAPRSGSEIMKGVGQGRSK